MTYVTDNLYLLQFAEILLEWKKRNTYKADGTV